MKHPAPRRPIFIKHRFVAGSVLVHFLVFFALPAPEKRESSPPVLSVQLQTSTPLPAALPADREKIAPAITRQKPSSPPTASIPPTVPDMPIIAAVALPGHTAEVYAASASTVESEQQSKIELLPTPRPAPQMPPPDVQERRGKPSTLWLAGYTKTISGQIARLKHYPSIARLRGWEGTTVIAIKLAADGSVLQTRIEQSSGHDVLDLQALAMLRQAEPLPPFPERHEGDPLTVQLPIVFALATP